MAGECMAGEGVCAGETTTETGDSHPTGVHSSWSRKPFNATWSKQKYKKRKCKDYEIIPERLNKYTSHRIVHNVQSTTFID